MSRFRYRFALLPFALTLALACDDSGTGIEGDGVTVAVPPSGGVVTSGDGETTLTVPAGAVAATTPITVTPVAAPPAGDGLVPGTAVRLEPSGMTFPVPIELAIEVESDVVSAGVPLATLAIHRRTGDAWVRVPGSTFDPARMVVKAPLTSFSVYAVLALGGPSQVDVSGDGQQTAAGGTVPLAPSLVVRSTAGHALPGLDVTFAVTSGGGTVTGGSTKTDEQGRATVGSWVLGPVVGTQTLEATVEGLASPVVFTAEATPSVATVAGTYDLARFTFTQLEDGQVSQLYDIADLLGDGASFELTLHPDGTTSGHFFVEPTPGEEGSGIDADLAGVWRLEGDTVDIDIAEDAFFDLLPYTFAEGRLTAGPGIVGDADDPLDIHEVILVRR